MIEMGYTKSMGVGSRRRRNFTAIKHGDFGVSRARRSEIASRKTAAMRLAEQMKARNVPMPRLLCENCLSPAVIQSDEHRDKLHCITCSRDTTKAQARLRRRQTIMMMLEEAEQA